MTDARREGLGVGSADIALQLFVGCRSRVEGVVEVDEAKALASGRVLAVEGSLAAFVAE